MLREELAIVDASLMYLRVTFTCLDRDTDLLKQPDFFSFLLSNEATYLRLIAKRLKRKLAEGD